jgi:transglutaminase-like putative cysteine protease
MLIRVGYELAYDCAQPTPMLLMLNVHSSRAGDLVVEDRLVTDPVVPVTQHRDVFGNRVSRLVAPAGVIRLRGDGVVRDSGLPDCVLRDDPQHRVEDLPAECLPFLRPSRYCESDLLSEAAWALFDGGPAGDGPTGAARVQAICDYAHRHLRFSYGEACDRRTAWQAWTGRSGVCRDYAHLAIAFCRALNIPARYCTGYVSDIGQPPPYPPMDFAAWIEAYVGGRWQAFDPRNNTPRIGRILMARGRDAADVALSTTFGPNRLVGFEVWTEQVKRAAPRPVLPLRVPEPVA